MLKFNSWGFGPGKRQLSGLVVEPQEHLLYISIVKGVIDPVPSLPIKCKKEFSQFRGSTWIPAERAPLPPPGCSSGNNRDSLGRKGQGISFEDDFAAIIQGHYFLGEYRHLPDEAPSTRLKKQTKRGS